MEMVGAIFASVTGGGAAAATGAAAAGAATSGISALSLLSGVGTVFSAVATIGAGAAARREARAQEAQQKFEATNEFIDGRETSAALKAELARTVANQTVAFAAGGAGLDSVSTREAKRQATKDAEMQLGSNDSSAGIRMLQRRRSAAAARARGDAAMTSSIFSAGQQLIGGGLDFAQRGG